MTRLQSLNRPWTVQWYSVAEATWVDSERATEVEARTFLAEVSERWEWRALHTATGQAI